MQKFICKKCGMICEYSSGDPDFDDTLPEFCPRENMSADWEPASQPNVQADAEPERDEFDFTHADTCTCFVCELKRTHPPGTEWSPCAPLNDRVDDPVEFDDDQQEREFNRTHRKLNEFLMLKTRTTGG